MLRTVAVHVQLADISAKARLIQLAHELQRRFGMDRREDGGAGRRGMEQIPREEGVAFSGVIEVGVAAFLGIGIPLQPVQELKIHRCTAVAVLRSMQMEIAHAGQNQPAAAVFYGDAGQAPGQAVIKAFDQTVFADEIAFARADFAGDGRIDDKALQGKCSMHAELLFKKNGRQRPPGVFV